MAHTPNQMAGVIATDRGRFSAAVGTVRDALNLIPNGPVVLRFALVVSDFVAVAGSSNAPDAADDWQ